MAILNYFKETKGEFKHVTWPSRKQTTIYTILIVLISLFASAYLGAFDWLFTRILSVIV